MVCMLGTEDRFIFSFKKKMTKKQMIDVSNFLFYIYRVPITTSSTSKRMEETTSRLFEPVPRRTLSRWKCPHTSKEEHLVS